MIIWRFIDGKPGHEKQSQALINHLSTRYKLEVIDFSINHSALFYCWKWLTGGNLGPKDPRKPSLIIGAGHKTHLPLLLASRKQRAKSLVIMSPSLPSHYFDLIVAPEHDYIQKYKPDNVLTTPFAIVDAINSRPDTTKGLILLGGPSKLFAWDSQAIAKQLHTLIEKYSENIHWVLSTSRRTPAQALAHIKTQLKHLNAKIELLSYNQLSSTWLNDQLCQAGHIWVSADSASMLAEALATRANVGIITMTSKKKKNKLLISQQNLLEKGIILSSSSTDYLPNTVERDINQNLTDDIIKHLGLTP